MKNSLIKFILTMLFFAISGIIFFLGGYYGGLIDSQKSGQAFVEAHIKEMDANRDKILKNFKVDSLSGVSSFELAKYLHTQNDFLCDTQLLTGEWFCGGGNSIGSYRNFFLTDKEYKNIF